MQEHISLLIIGAGPFGLSTAAYAQAHDMDYLVVGKPMSAWKENMPKGMWLRSSTDWHLDPTERYTFEKYVETVGKSFEEVNPVKLEFYLDYVQWFQEKSELKISERWVEKLDVEDDGKFSATFSDGGALTADYVLLAVGFGYFPHVPENLGAMIPAGRYIHTRDLQDPESFKNQRLLMIGGRQSAYETTALLQEAGAENIHISHRHESPLFTESFWDWVQPIINRVRDEPTWFRDLSEEEQKDLNHRFWVEGRRKLEPWLAPRIQKPNVFVWEKSNMVGCQEQEDGSLHIKLDTGDSFSVDKVVFGTGYQVNMERIPFLKAGNILEKMECRNGYPKLNPYFESSIPQLYISSMAALQDFGLFFAFTLSAVVSAQIIGREIETSLNPS